MYLKRIIIGQHLMQSIDYDSLNLRVFKKIGFQLCKEDLESIIKCETGTIERVLRFVQL